MNDINTLKQNKSYLVSKIETAERVLFAASPWIEPVKDRLGISIVGDDNLSVVGFPNMWIFIGDKFIFQSTPDELMLSLEYAIIQCLNDSVKKASMLSDSNPQNLSCLAVSLEINSQIAARYESMSQTEWDTLMSKSIDSSYRGVFKADNVPKIPDSFWLPEDFNMDRGLSADKYLKGLIEYSHQKEQDWIDEKIDNNSMVKSLTEHKESNNPKEPTEVKEDELSTNDNLLPEDTTGSDDSDKDKRVSLDDLLDRPYHDEISDILGIDDEDVDYNEDSEEYFVGLNESVLDASDVISRSQIRKYSLSDFVDNEYILDLAGNRGGGDGFEGISYQDKQDMEKEISKKFDDYQFQNPGKNKNELNLWTKWSSVVKSKSKAKWKRSLNKKLTPMMGKAIQQGETDLSFSKRNPNQQPDQPLMMAMVTFDPVISVLVDASPSMLKHQSQTITEVTEVLQKVFVKYGTAADIAMVDNKVRYVFSTATPSKRMKKAIARTYQGGSSGFGHTLGVTLKKGIKYRSGNYPKPNLTIVVTDCFFDDWPYQDKTSLPNRIGSVIIVSVEPWDKVKSYLPPWVKKGTNFFEAL